MDSFTVMELRGHVLNLDDEAVDYRRRMIVPDGGQVGDENVHIARGPVPTSRAGGRKMSARDYRSPQDLMRSRRVGLSRTVCISCAAAKDQGLCLHAKACKLAPTEPERFFQIKTGPMTSNETSKDVGWR